MEKNLVQTLVKAYIKGDTKLENFEDSDEKSKVLELKRFIRCGAVENPLKDNDIENVREMLIISNDEKRCEILLGILDNYTNLTSPSKTEIRLMMTEYRDLLMFLKYINV